MSFEAKNYIGPSIVFHLMVMGLIVLVCLNAPALKSPKEKQFKVQMVSSVARVNTSQMNSARKPSSPPIKPQVEKPKPVKPKVEKPKPVKPKVVKPKPIVKRPPPKKTIIKTPPRKTVKRTPPKVPKTTNRKVMVMPETIKNNQEKWLDDRQKKNKPIETDYKPIEREVTVGKQVLETTKNNPQEFETVRNEINNDLKNLKDSLKTSAYSGPSQGRDYNKYRGVITTSVEPVWIKPSVSLVPKYASCKIGFRVSRNGSVSNVRVLNSSGYSALDSSAIAAVKAARFPAFPADYADAFFDVELDFDCEPEK